MRKSALILLLLISLLSLPGFGQKDSSRTESRESRLFISFMAVPVPELWLGHLGVGLEFPRFKHSLEMRSMFSFFGSYWGFFGNSYMELWSIPAGSRCRFDGGVSAVLGDRNFQFWNDDGYGSSYTTAELGSTFDISLSVPANFALNLGLGASAGPLFASNDFDSYTIFRYKNYDQMKFQKIQVLPLFKFHVSYTFNRRIKAR